MSNRERAIRLLDQIPDNKMIFVVEMLNSIKGLLIEEIEPDEWDLTMMKEAEKENDGTTISIEDLSKELGIEL